jgi:hypothetical protein
MVVARPRVTPAASLTRRPTSAPMRLAAVRPRAADAGGVGAVEAVTSEVTENRAFGGYLSSPPTIKRAPVSAAACAERPAGEKSLAAGASSRVLDQLLRKPVGGEEYLESH